MPEADTADGRLDREEKYLEQIKRAMTDRNHTLLRETYDSMTEAVKNRRLNLIFLQEISYRIYYMLMDLIPGDRGEGVCLEALDWRNQTCFNRFEDWSRLLWEQIEGVFSHVEGQEERNQGITVKVIAYARQHFREPITLKEVAERFFISSSYLGRSFQKATGVPFKQYVNELRIEEAKRLLRQTDRLIYEIAEETGFAESKYFIARFTAMVGMSPMEYRKMSEKG